MQALSATPVAAEYTQCAGTEVLLGKIAVVVITETHTNQSGSYERGLKWTTTTYGYLKRNYKTRPSKYSPDHGVTWYDTLTEAKKQRAGRVRVNVAKSEEFAFKAIQRINRSYDSAYKWRP